MDPTTAALRALAAQSAWTPALAFAAGAASSLSPCVAPRMLAVAALAAAKPANCAVRTVTMFTAGVVAAYSVLTLGGTLLWQVVKYSGYFYSIIAMTMAAAGVIALTRHSPCPSQSSTHSKETMSSVFLLGASSVATFSPCCMSVIVAAVLYAHSTGPVFAWVTVTSFALGHAGPLTLAAAGSRAVGFVMDAGVQSAARVVAGTLMLAIAGFYCVLA